MADDKTPYQKFINIEEQKQPQLRELKKQFLQGIVWAVGIFAGLSLSNAIPVAQLQPFALAFGFAIFLIFLLLFAWRIWEYVRFKL